MKTRIPATFPPELIDLLNASETTGRSGRKFTNLGPMSTVNNLAILQAMMLEFKPINTLEIGLCHGASCMLFTSMHRMLGGEPSHQHCAIDPFQESVYDGAGLLQIEQAGLAGYLDFQCGFSSVVLAQKWKEGRRYNLIYVDGSHLFEDVFLDFYYSARLLDEGGVVAFDDCTDPHVLKVLAFIRSNMAGHFEELDTNRFKSFPMNGLKYQLARRMGKVQFTAFRKIGPGIREWDACLHRF